MSEHIFYPPPAQAPLVLVKTKKTYHLWHDHLTNIKRVDRYTIGTRIDDTFLSFLEQVFHACFASDKFEKLACISSAIAKCDLVKFLLQLAWEEKIIDAKRYGAILLNLDEIGRMLGGWKRMVINKTPVRK